jgi:uncharacterized protein YehS (DUF1456 family)
MLSNNDVFKKVKIATAKLSGLKDADFKECFRLGGHEITVANFDSYKVSTENRRYKPMPDEALESFLNGLVTFSQKEL